MAMNNSNNTGYPPASNLSPPFASTPSNVRPQRPRFAYSGPPNYPRPRSSASKPNPDSSFSQLMRSRYIPSDRMNDSMVNNFGGSEHLTNTSLLFNDNSLISDYDSSFHSQNSTVFYSCSESFNESPRKSHLLKTPQTFCSPPRHLAAPEHPYKTNMFGISNGPASFTNQQNQFKAPSSLAPSNKRKPFYKKPRKATDSKSEWRCSVCEIEFTSSIPYEMHLRGAKHAKKFKSKDALQTIQLQVSQTKEIAPIGTSFRCDLCGIITNSSLQLQTHLDGLKHKTKLLQQQQKQVKENKDVTEAAGSDSQVNGKSNGAPVNITPSDIVARILKKKTAIFSCDICSITVNSDFQLQQHLKGKYHLAQVEGKPILKRRSTFLNKKSDNVKAEERGASTVEEMEQCETITSVGSSETTKAIDPSETTKAIDPSETIEAVDPPETTKAVDTPEATKAVDTPEATKAVDTPEATKAVDTPETTKAVDTLENTEAIDIPETTKVVESSETNKTVVGVKTLSASFVHGETMK